MKFYLLLLLLLFSSSVNAALVEWNADVSINDDGSNDWIVTLTYNETVTKSDYFVLAKIYNVEIFADNSSIFCDITEDIGMSIVCNNLQATEVVYKFHTKKFVENIQSLKMFKYAISVTQIVDRMHLTIRLPLGTGVVEDLKLSGTGLKPFEPDFGRSSTDGRKISVSWTFDKPVLGQTINVYIIYEMALGFDPFTLFTIILTLIIIAFLATIYMFSKKHNVRDILPVLTDSERKVMEILLREKGEVDQRVVVKETDFSKAKVSRITS
jgi:uncharacterized membrane protein